VNRWVLSVLRSVGSVLAGLVVAFVLVVAAEVFGSIFHPFPPGIDPTDLEACKAHVARFPTWVLAVGAGFWAAAALSGAWLAAFLGPGRHSAHGFVVGAILLALAVFNMSMLAYPIWFPIVNLLTFPLVTILGVRLAKPRSIPQA
jgi:hypothetical protein